MQAMSGYRCVNYYELCRLCTASHGIKKVNIFGDEGRRCNLYEKIAGCLPIDVSICHDHHRHRCFWRCSVSTGKPSEIRQESPRYLIELLSASK